MEFSKKLREKLKARPAERLDFNRKRRHFDIRSLIPFGILAAEIAAVVCAAWLLVSAFGRVTVCLGRSMEPTIRDGDRVLTDRIIYKVRAPERGDIVIFRPAGNLSANYSIKRVAAVPGDTVQIINSALYINGRASTDSFSSILISDAGLAQNPITLGKDEYFLLGDNRNTSEDSRFASIGNVHAGEIIGKPWFIVTPGNIGLMQ